MRFRRSIRLAKGVRINFSKSGLGISVGTRGFRVGVGPRGAYRTIGIPGTGLYDTQYVHTSTKTAGSEQSQAEEPLSVVPLIVAIVLALLLWLTKVTLAILSLGILIYLLSRLMNRMFSSPPSPPTEG